MIDDTNVEGMTFHFKTFRILSAHGCEVEALFIQSGYEGGINFIPVAMAFMDAVLAIDGAEFSFGKLDIKAALA